MKQNNSMYVTNAMVFIAGVLLIILHDRVNIMAGIVVIVGIMFAVPSVIALLMTIIQRNKRATEMEGKHNSYLSVIPSIGGLCLGVFLILKPDIFIGILAYMFAAILVIAGLYHIIFLVILSKTIKMPGWFYILPTLIAISGLVILLSDVRTIESIVVLITGIALICFTINSVLEYIGLKVARKGKLTI